MATITPLGSTNPAYAPPPQDQQQNQQPGPYQQVQPVGQPPGPATPYNSGYATQPQGPVGAVQGPYGQNTTAAQRDQQWQQQQQQQQQQWQQQQQQQQQMSIYQPQAVNDPYMTVFSPVTATPPGLYMDGTDDAIYVYGYHTAWLIFLCVVGLLWAALLISLIAGSRGVAVIIIFVIASIALLVGGWFTDQQRVVFCKGRCQVELVRRRIMFHPCGEHVVNRFAFAEITGVGFTGGAGVAAELYMETATTRIILGRRQYNSNIELQADVVAWQQYAASLRGVSFEAFVAQTASQFMSTIANAVARR